MGKNKIKRNLNMFFYNNFICKTNSIRLFKFSYTDNLKTLKDRERHLNLKYLNLWFSKNNISTGKMFVEKG